MMLSICDYSEVSGTVVHENQNKANVVDDCALFVPGGVSVLQQEVAGLLNFVRLVVRGQLVYHVLVLEELPHTVRGNHDNFVILGQCMLYLKPLLPIISGSQLTPTDAATRSPKLRVIARPGPLESFNQTLKGPTGLPILY